VSYAAWLRRSGESEPGRTFHHTGKAQGKTLSEIEDMPAGIMSDILGKRLVATRPGCAYLGLNTLKLQ
jgi:hypothetical protein